MARIPKPTGRKSHLGEMHLKASSARLEGDRQYKKQIIVACEGEETEFNYFMSLKLDFRNALVEPVKVEIYDSKGKADPLHVVERGITEREKRRKSNWDDDLDEVWCVFDVEQENINRHIPEAVQIAHGEGLRLAISNPCFEYWYLLHFEKTGRVFANCDEVEREIKRKRRIPNYDKAMSVYPLLKPPKMDLALKNASELRHENPEIWESCHLPANRPATDVDILVRLITGK